MEKQIEYLCNNKGEFAKFVYVSCEEAIAELNRRKIDKTLEKQVDDFLKGSIPEPLVEKEKFVLARHLITPNYEVSRFLIISDAMGFEPLFFEYLDDKLIYQNPWKYSLGKIPFYSGKDKNDSPKIKKISIIDFNNSHGKKISAANTNWGQSLVDFHHEFFNKRFPGFKKSIFDGSSWYSNNGESPIHFYERFFALFIRHGILFENFLLDETEYEFTQKVILPAIINISNRFNLKPLIVSLMPTEVEGEGFWLSHPACTYDFVNKKLPN